MISSVVQKLNHSCLRHRPVNQIRNFSFLGCCGSLAWGTVFVECCCLLRSFRIDTHLDACKLSSCSVKMSVSRPTHDAVRPLNHTCDHLIWKEMHVVRKIEKWFKERKWIIEIPFTLSTSMLLVMNLLLLFAHFPWAPIKLFKPPICASSASLNVLTPSMRLIGDFTCGISKSMTFSSEKLLWRSLPNRVRSGGAGNLYHLKSGFALKNASLY